jgi:mono/diheme cytochrome c family protein
MPIRNILTFIALVAALAVVGAAYQVKIEKAPPKSTPANSGKDMFKEYCAVCHGEQGTGNGPAASALKKAPADLTQLAAKNGGKFPDVRVSRYISGDDTVLAHGNRDMPIWGDVFKSMSRDPGMTALRVSNLTTYVQSLQAK